MDFEIEHAFDAPAEHVAAALLDEDYQRSLSRIGPLAERTLLSQRRGTGGRIVRRTRCVLDIDVGGPARKFIGGADPAWVEEAVWDGDRMRWEWTILPEAASDLLAASGTMGVIANGRTTRRVVAGEVRVRVPLYGGRVESWIVEGLKKAYDEEAEVLARWLKSA